jgi:hypothetical protein
MHRLLQRKDLDVANPFCHVSDYTSASL